MPCQGCRRLRASSRHFFHISRSGIGFLQSGLVQPLRKSGGSGDWDPALEHSVLQFFPINRLMLQALLSFKGMFCHLAKASSSTFSVLFFNEKTDSALWLDKKKIYIRSHQVFTCKENTPRERTALHMCWTNCTAHRGTPRYVSEAPF